MLKIYPNLDMRGVTVVSVWCLMVFSSVEELDISSLATSRVTLPLRASLEDSAGYSHPFKRDNSKKGYQ